MFASISVTASVSLGCRTPKRACSATRWRSSGPRTRSTHRISFTCAWTVAPNSRSTRVRAKSMLAAPPQDVMRAPSISYRCGLSSAWSARMSTSGYSDHGSAARAPFSAPDSASHSTPAPTPPQHGAARQRATTVRRLAGRSPASASSATSSTRCQCRWSAVNLSGLRTSTCRRSGPSTLAARRSGCTRPDHVSESGSPACTSSTRSGASCAKRDSSSGSIEKMSGTMRDHHSGASAAAGRLSAFHWLTIIPEINNIAPSHLRPPIASPSQTYAKNAAPPGSNA